MLQYLLTPDNPYLHSQVYSFVSDMSPLTERFIPDASESTLIITKGPYRKPFHAAELVHPLLSQVSASKQTSVISNDVLFRTLLSNHFLYMHPVIYPFQVQYFLEDMASCTPRFCSSLLVNAVIASSYVRVIGRHESFRWMQLIFVSKYIAKIRIRQCIGFLRTSGTDS